MPSARRRRAHFTLLAAGEQSLDVLDADQDDEGDEDRESREVDEGLPLGWHSAAPHRLDEHDRDPPAVERRERQDVEDRQIDRQQADEKELADERGLEDAAGL